MPCGDTCRLQHEPMPACCMSGKQGQGVVVWSKHKQCMGDDMQQVSCQIASGCGELEHLACLARCSAVPSHPSQAAIMAWWQQQHWAGGEWAHWWGQMWAQGWGWGQGWQQQGGGGGGAPQGLSWGAAAAAAQQQQQHNPGVGVEGPLNRPRAGLLPRDGFFFSLLNGSAGMGGTHCAGGCHGRWGICSHLIGAAPVPASLPA